jgi:hypothetical protein
MPYLLNNSDAAIAALLIAMAVIIAVCAVVLLVLYRRLRRDSIESRERGEKVTDYLVQYSKLSAKLEAERASPVPDLTLIRTYENELKRMETENGR